MAVIAVNFTFHSGLKRQLFRNVRLTGSWDSSGTLSSAWSIAPMTASLDIFGCDAFSTVVSFDSSQLGASFQWGVIADVAHATDSWVIATEVADADSDDRTRAFMLAANTTQQEYWFVTGRRFGAQKCLAQGASATALQFSVWAPHAQQVDVVFAPFDTGAGSPTGYIADDGTGIDPTALVIPLISQADGVWSSDVSSSPVADFSAYLNRLYMYRIKNQQGVTTYKVDLFSRNQAGRGNVEPSPGTQYTGSYLDLDGILSCSIVSDPDQVTQDFNDTGIEKQSLISADQFWQDEYSPDHLPPTRIQDLIIYELHVGSLGFPAQTAGSFSDAMAFVQQLTDLGVNAVELLPVLQFDGDLQWGYGTSLFFCFQSSAGGANQLKHLVRACHRQGIAVILDVVYNHFAGSDNSRSEWGYDCDPDVAAQDNIWYWYQGLPTQYADITGGYLDNGSSGWTPRFSEENVRQTFTSSAAVLLDEFHIDGIRVDLTDAIHQNNVLHADGSSVGIANQYGIKFLRELARTVKLVNPGAFLIAEDHTGWPAMTQPLDQSGIGFDAVWYSDFYHHLIGDGDYGDSYARLLKMAGFGINGPLNMDYFAGALLASQYDKIIYHENHDEAGNDTDTERTILTAVNRASLIGLTRQFAEARSRVAFGMSALSAGTPMFLMGEEIGAANFFLYDTFAQNKEDLIGARTGTGRFIYRFYQDLIRFVQSKAAARSTTIDVVYRHNDNRVIAFTRGAPARQLLIVASLNDTAFTHGYVIGTDPARLPAGAWQEVFNSDAAVYGGNNVGNAGAALPVNGGVINTIIPARGFIVFEKT
jgi:1,4-alpha-glucan branching enzyme